MDNPLLKVNKEGIDVKNDHRCYWNVPIIEFEQAEAY